MSELLGCMSFGVHSLMDPEKEVQGWYYLLGEELGRKKHLKVATQHKSNSTVALCSGIETAPRRSPFMPRVTDVFPTQKSPLLGLMPARVPMSAPARSYSVARAGRASASFSLHDAAAAAATHTLTQPSSGVAHATEPEAGPRVRG
ncbi:Regulator of G-protein signaling 3 [Liparis tanakae]|uniref:Regulator of G-protein signaling 3 n=1 Tax=Liparis tanakae TaxID=230148 RepID=A0A4Z2I6Y3_9TELE|nr:Regulator of G-protein signaling 3 [Liparis tanakae]